MVPPGKERVRLSVMATYRKENLDKCADLFRTIGARFGLFQ